MVAQSAAQMSALLKMMRYFEEMRTALAPSQPSQPTTAHQPARPRVLDVNALAGEPLYCFLPPSAPTSIRQPDAYATQVSASQPHTQTIAPLGLPTLSTVAGSAVHPANQSNPQTASTIAPPSQYAPVRFTSSESGPTVPQSVAPSALHTLAAFSAAPPAAPLPTAFLQLAARTPVALPESFVFAATRPAARPPAVVSQLAAPANAQFAMAHPAAPSQAAFAQFAATTVAQLGVYAQLAASAGAQPADFAANCDKKDSNTLIKLSSRARLIESSGSHILGFVADFEFDLGMCRRPVRYWGYFLVVSLGTEEAEKVRRSHVVESVADYPTFTKGV